MKFKIYPTQESATAVKSAKELRGKLNKLIDKRLSQTDGAIKVTVIGTSAGGPGKRHHKGKDVA